jgi:hypothetical protein
VAAFSIFELLPEPRDVMLTEDQIRELTGYRQHARQLRWIADQLKIKAPIRADGLPILTEAQLNAALAGQKIDEGEYRWSRS